MSARDLSPGYRPEIDGLRAIAVAAVILYHAEFLVGGAPWLPGGFVGVDVFFVISGYLISKIIIAAAESERGFSLAEFYERRARRILPVLFLVMAATFLAGLRFLLPEDLEELGASLLSSMLFVSNFFFHFSTTEYGADSALLKPLLHTWSLSVEEQFYILFPFALIALLGLPPRRRLAILWLAFLASLGLAEALSRTHPSLNFYLLPSRAWELLAGLLVLLWERHGASRLHPAAQWLAPAAGLGLIVAAFFLFNEDSRHPGLVTLVPVLGTALVLRYGGASDPATALLTARPVVVVGLLSYSLYLWHFPVFAFARIQADDPSNLAKVAWIALAFGLSVFSYRVVERPFRNRARMRWRPALATLVGGATLLTGTALAALVYDGFELRVPPIVRYLEAERRYNAWIFSPGPGATPCNSRVEDYCQFGPAAATPMFVIGDSHGARLVSALRNEFVPDYRVVAMSLPACWPLADFEKLDHRGIPDTQCSAATQHERLAEIGRSPRAVVVLFGRLPLYLTGRDFQLVEGKPHFPPWQHQYVAADRTFAEGVVATAQGILRQGHTLVLVYPTPEFGRPVARTVLSLIPRDFSKVPGFLRDHDPVAVPVDAFRERTRSSFAVLDAIAGGAVVRVYPHELFCDPRPGGRCVAHDSEDLFFLDSNHLSAVGAARVAAQIRQGLTARGPSLAGGDAPAYGAGVGGAAP